MKNKMIKTTVAMPALRIADPSYNMNEIIGIIQDHTDSGLLLFPELCISGYTCADLFFQQSLLDACKTKLTEIARIVPVTMTVVVGLPLQYKNKIYNVAAYLSAGEIRGIVPKINIPNYGEFYEARWFASGKEIEKEYIEIEGMKIPFGTKYLFKDFSNGACIGTDICEDLWVPDKPSTHACMAGANIIVNPSASDEVIGKQDYRRMMVMMQSSSCYCAYLYCSSAMDESSTDLVFSGHSMIAENGRMLKDVIFPQIPCTESAIIDLDTINYNRIHQSTYPDQDEYEYIEVSVSSLCQKENISVDELVNVLKEENYPIARNPFVPADDEERWKRCRKILQIQANGLATRVRHTGIKNLVIGVSGGLDSTLALIVCNEARKIVKDIRIIAYTLPNRGNTTSLTYNNAVDLMKALDAEIREVAIEESVKKHLEDIGHGGIYKGDNDITYENAQARMRTYILMDAANMENGLVVGTGDLSELALGWCTYNGDHMSMYGVNASVPKTLVQYICKAYALATDNAELRRVLLSIIDTPISPELTPNKDGQIAQKTEEKIGKYDLNDFFLFYVLRYGFTPEKILSFALIAFPEVSKETMKDALKRFYNRFFHQQFKRSCLPDGPKVGSVTLSPRGDWRMPSDASVSLWLKEIENA